MTVYDRDPDGPAAVVDRWDGGAGWLVAPDETGRRASHVVRGTDGGAWLLDPLEAPCIDDLVAALGGTVAGVAVCSSYHARDAAALARRYDVPLTVPAWVDRVPDRADGTLYVPDLLGTAPGCAAPGERLGVVFSERFFPPREAFADLDPDRVLVGHGTGVFADAGAALADALAGARRRIPRVAPLALGPMVRGLWASLWE